MADCLRAIQIDMLLLPIAVPGEPRNVYAQPVNSSTVEVSWDPPDDANKNGVIRGYQIYVQPKNVNTPFA